jgi:hypothetical protein
MSEKPPIKIRVESFEMNVLRSKITDAETGAVLKGVTSVMIRLDARNQKRECIISFSEFEFVGTFNEKVYV